MKNFNFNSNVKDLDEIFKSEREKQKSYVDFLETERLQLTKQEPIDCVSTEYEIYLKDTQVKVGVITFMMDDEIWYFILEKHQNKGYATEALLKLMEENKDKAYYVVIDPKNKASVKVAKKIGFNFSVSYFQLYKTAGFKISFPITCCYMFFAIFAFYNILKNLINLSL